MCLSINFVAIFLLKQIKRTKNNKGIALADYQMVS